MNILTVRGEGKEGSRQNKQASHPPLSQEDSIRATALLPTNENVVFKPKHPALWQLHSADREIIPPTFLARFPRVARRRTNARHTWKTEREN